MEPQCNYLRVRNYVFFVLISFYSNHKPHLRSLTFCIALEGSGIEQEHCDLKVSAERVILHSIAGPTYINGRIVEKDWELRQGDVLQFGHFLKFRFHNPMEAEMLREKRRSGVFASSSNSGRMSPAVSYSLNFYSKWSLLLNPMGSMKRNLLLLWIGHQFHFHSTLCCINDFWSFFFCFFFCPNLRRRHFEDIIEVRSSIKKYQNIIVSYIPPLYFVSNVKADFKSISGIWYSIDI